MIKISDIKPYANNAKKHPKSQLIALAKIVKEVGWRQPVLVNQKGVIVAGHGRWATWKNYADEYSLKDIWIIDDKGDTVYGSPESSPLTEEQENSYRFADNKLNESDWDMKLALVDLKLLSLPMFELTGFDKDILLDSDDKDDAVPLLPSKAQSKKGDFYELEKHKIFCGDSTEQESISKLGGKGKIDMIFTDPPYGVDYISRVDKKRRKDWGAIKNDNLKDKALVDFIRDTVPKTDTAKYICCNWQSVKDFFEALGMPNSLIVWDKKSIGLGANYRSQLSEPT